jgi:hypothetical protein
MYKGLLVVFFTWLLLISCSTKQETVEITLPLEIKARIEKAAPMKDYGFYALKISHPVKYEDLKEWSLFVCDGDNLQMDIDVTISSLTTTKTLLFKFSKNYFIATNMSGGNPDDPSKSFNTTLQGPGRDKIILPREGLIFSKEMTSEKLFTKCLKDLQENQKGLLLVKRTLASKNQKDLVEIKFK